MSVGKDRGNQSRDTASEDALVARSKGATDAQISDTRLRQGLPHLTDPASLQDSRADKQPEGTGTAEKDKQLPAEKKRTRTTSQAMQTQPLLQDLGGWQDDDAEKDLEESQRGSGQDASV